MTTPNAAAELNGRARADSHPEDRIRYLTDEQLRQGAELMFFAYRAFTSDADEILRQHGYWRAHHRALHFIGAGGARTVTELIEILGVTKQSLNRVLRELIEKGLVEQKVSATDRRRRPLFLTEKGAELERQLATAQRARVRQAFRDAGPEAVEGFRKVLEQMLDDGDRGRLVQIIERANAGAEHERPREG